MEKGELHKVLGVPIGEAIPPSKLLGALRGEKGSEVATMVRTSLKGVLNKNKK